MYITSYSNICASPFKMVSLIVFSSYLELGTIKADFFRAYHNGRVLNSVVSCVFRFVYCYLYANFHSIQRMPFIHIKHR